MTKFNNEEEGLRETIGRMRDKPIHFKNPAQGNAKRWSNHKLDFVKCEIGLDEFDRALEEGYEVFTQADKLAYLRRPKQA